MDVRCERCRAQYVFDDDQVTETGVTVQCSNCGHLFKVKKKALVVTVPVRPGEVSEEPPIAPVPSASSGSILEAPRTPHPTTTPFPEKKEWRVRQANGNVFAFKELTTLQKWIVERKVGRDDQISLSGDQWKRLGNIAELATFFQVVEAAERGQVQPAVTPMPAPFPSGYPSGPYPAAYPPPAPPYSGQGIAPPIPLHGGMLPAGGPVTQVNVSLPPNPTAAWEGQAAQPRATAPEPAWTADARIPLDDELGTAELRLVKGGGGRWILLLLLVAAGAAAVYVAKPELLGFARNAPPPPPAEVKAAPPHLPAPPQEPPKQAQPPEPVKPAQPPEPIEAPAILVEPKPAPRKAAPRTAAALIAEAKRLRDRGKTQQALDLFGQAAEIEPDSAEALTGRGWCYLDLSQYAPAEASFQAALEQESGSDDALMGLAETYRYQGRKAEAVKYYEKYLAVHPEGDDAVAARNAISQLKE